ncbi:MAG: hypothetical protein ACKVKG_09340 [Alphaproteobacteria bacterium]
MSDRVDRPLVHILISVWDKAFIDKFVDFALPTHVSPGNLPALCGEARVHYHFYTNAVSADYLENRTRALARFATIHVRTFESTLFEGHTLAQHLASYSGDAFKNHLNQFSVFHLLDDIADKQPTEYLFVGDSDLLYSNCAFPSLLQALQSGA